MEISTVNEIINTAWPRYWFWLNQFLLSFVSKTLIYLQRNVLQVNWNHAVLIYNNDSIGIASFLTDMYFSIIE